MVFRGSGLAREAGFVVSRVKELMGEGFNTGDVAVFYRTNAQSRAFEEALRRSDLPPSGGWGAVAFYQRREVKDVMAYLQVVSNPDDGVALRRVLNTPRRGIGRTSLGLLESHASGLEVTPVGGLGGG